MRFEISEAAKNGKRIMIDLRHQRYKIHIQQHNLHQLGMTGGIYYIRFFNHYYHFTLFPKEKVAG